MRKAVFWFLIANAAVFGAVVVAVPLYFCVASLLSGQNVWVAGGLLYVYALTAVGLWFGWGS